MAERLKARLLDTHKLADLVVGPDAYRDLPRILAAVQVGMCVVVAVCALTKELQHIVSVEEGGWGGHLLLISQVSLLSVVC